MSRTSVNAPIKQAPTTPQWVWFEGSTALSEGQGVCYNWDYGTAENVDGRRLNRVELPTILNARYFAGVAARDYSANTGGQMIEIYTPGSACNILSKADTTIGVGRLTCEAGGTYAGYFRYAGFEGEGSAVPLQTVDRSNTAGKCFALLEVGPPSGLVEDVLPVDNTAITCMVGGVTYFTTAVTLTNGDSTFALADGTIPGLKKAFVCQATMTTNQVDIAPTSAVQGVANADPTAALAHAKFNADTEEVTLEWNAFDAGGLWVIVHYYGADLS